MLFQHSQRNLPPEEDSLDAEDIFDLEGMDSHPEMGSDQDDYDSDSESFYFIRYLFVLIIVKKNIYSTIELCML